MLDAYLRSAAAKRRAEEQKRMQAQREAQRAYEKFLKDQEAAQRKAAAEAERAEKAKVRQREAEARKHEAAQRRAEAERDRLAKARERERRQLAAEAERAAARRLVEEKIAEADRRTREVADFMDALEHVLSSRATGGRLHRSTAEAAFTARGPDGLVSVLTSVMNTSTYPAGIFARIVAAEFRPESAELLAACDLPRMDILPTARTYRYVKSRNTTLIEPQPAAELQDAYRRLLARLVLRSLAELFDVCPEGLVASISLNAFVPTKDKATGQPTRPLLISVNAERGEFGGIALDEPELDPVLCLRQALNAIISDHPADLEPVRPVIQFDPSRRGYKVAHEELTVAAGLDSRQDLLAITPKEFEYLVRELFEAMGMKSWVTQASKDDGVDAIAVNEDPIVGGMCIIQAKRWSGIVGLESVNALAGVMGDKRAAKGVLVTTSWVGKASREFAVRNGRMEIIEGRHLKALLQEHLGLDVLISLPKLPPGWEPRDVG